MDHFNSPPGWPAPPEPNWQPPPGWRPDPAWPPAPPRWRFWLNERGARSLGPRGRYGAIGRGRLVAAGTTAAIVLILGLSALGGGTGKAAAPGPKVPGPTVTVTVQQTIQQTVPGPTATITAAPMPARTVSISLPRATITITARPALVARSTETTAPDATVYYANCAAARAAGAAPLYVGNPGYDLHLDRDHDGVACE
jgi:hypothetical protein